MTLIRRDGTQEVVARNGDIPADYRALVDPEIDGTPTPVVAINGGASSGSRHIEDATPTLAEAEVEQIVWAFDEADLVYGLILWLSGPTGYVYNGTNVLVNEVARAAFTVFAGSTGDASTAATRLMAETVDANVILPNSMIFVPVGAPVRTVYALAKLTSHANVIQGGFTIGCKGVSHA